MSTYTIDTIEDWEPGDSIEVAGSLHRNQIEAINAHAINFYGNEPIGDNIEREAREMIDQNWFGELFTVSELIEIIAGIKKGLENGRI